MLIAQMVGRNESSRFLRPVLERLSRQVDSIVFTDDCSDDDTLDIASEYAEVYRMDEPTFVLDESRLRESAWKNLENHAQEGDWILAIDCDEMFYPSHRIDEWLSQERYDVLGITFYHMWNELQYRVDKAWKPTLSSRLFRFKTGGSYRNRRLACGAEPTYVVDLIRNGSFSKDTDFKMQHLGYLRDEDKISKHKRYMELDKGDFHSIQHLNSIVDRSVRLENWRDAVQL